MRTLQQLRVGSTAILSAIGGQRAFRRRLMEMGLLPGTPVRLMRRVEVGGLVQLRVRGCSVSLRVSEAERLRFEAATDATDSAG
jgi:Fe2+ transport system protein FeoA